MSYKVVGSIIGFLTGSISVSGSPLVLFLNAAKVDNKQFREIFGWFNIVTALIAIGGCIHLYLITGAMLN
ncbi:MAG: hypothetical protein JW717_07620 [Marinilabiliaceae bacterium]|nr:hypothetical protein [Marinilabiliaceae bacterium]